MKKDICSKELKEGLDAQKLMRFLKPLPKILKAVDNFKNHEIFGYSLQ